MSESTPLLFAPGWPFHYQVQHPDYQGNHDHVMDTLEEAGFEPYFHQPDWPQDDPESWAAAMAEHAEALPLRGRSLVLAGFSLGGISAVLAADRLQKHGTEASVKGLLLCSLSPWFGAEPVRRSHLIPQSEIHLMTEQLKAKFRKLELPGIDCPVQLYVGRDEISSLHRMRDIALEHWPQTESITPLARHNIFDVVYLDAIRQNAGRLATGSW